MSEGWLSTRQAAARLDVSEATVRRWADQGMLPSRRIGRRGNRRFDPEQLERPETSGRGPIANRSSRGASVSIGGHDIPLPVHLATFYDSDVGRTRMATRFLADGLRAGQPCLLIAEGEALDAHLRALAPVEAAGVDDARPSATLVLGAAPGSTVEEALAYWEDQFWHAVERGATAIRVLAEMESEREVFESEQEMLDYEAQLSRVTDRFPCAVICQYDVRKFSGQAIFSALRAHTDLLEVPRTLASTLVLK